MNLDLSCILNHFLMQSTAVNNLDKIWLFDRWPRFLTMLEWSNVVWHNNPDRSRDFDQPPQIHNHGNLPPTNTKKSPPMDDPQRDSGPKIDNWNGHIWNQFGQAGHLTWEPWNPESGFGFGFGSLIVKIHCDGTVDDLVRILVERGKCILVEIPYSYFWQKFQEVEFYHFPQIIIETSIWYYRTVRRVQRTPDVPLSINRTCDHNRK